ncbi:hypothetical protein GN956_G3722 [Arapaima gigas]
MYVNGTKEKHAVQTNNRLVIQNFTSEDSATYYCAIKKNDILTFSKGTRLNITGKITEDQNLTTAIEEPKENLICLNLFLIISITANVILAIVVTVLTTRLYQALRSTRVKKLDKPEEDIVYSVIQMPATQNLTKSQTACIYSKIHTPLTSVHGN